MALGEYLNVFRQEILENNNEHKNMAIDLLKRKTGLTNRQIGRMFCDISYSAVSKGISAIFGEIEKRQKNEKGNPRGHDTSLPSQGLTPSHEAIKGWQRKQTENHGAENETYNPRVPNMIFDNHGKDLYNIKLPQG